MRREFVLKTCDANSDWFRYASERLRSDRDIALAALAAYDRGLTVTPLPQKIIPLAILLKNSKLATLMLSRGQLR